MPRSTVLGAVLAALMSVVALAPHAAAADYSYRTNEQGEGVLMLSGRITGVDGAIFLNEVKKHQPRIVELQGLGGDMLSAARIGVIIHERDLSTHAVGTCRSACAYIWIAGRRMLADEGVEISNHLPVAMRGEGEGEPNLRGTALFGWYLGKLNVSVDMMSDFLDRATRHGGVSNEYFDMLAFARHWNAPVTIVPAEARVAAAGG